jgi:hypothetical protein
MSEQSENLHRNNAAEWAMWCVVRPIQLLLIVLIRANSWEK